MWDYCLPVTALALSARRPFGPAGFRRRLDNDVHDKDDNQDEELAAPGQDCPRSCRHRKGREASRSCAGLRRLMSNIIVVMFDDDEEVFSKSGLQPFLPSSFEGFDRLAL